MDAYVYQAALICSDCEPKVQADIIMRGLDTPGGWAKFVGWEREDSSHFPQGPYANGGGEADCPQHCDICTTFLENPLTSDGVEYVQHVVSAASAMEILDGCIAEWSDFYGITRS